MRRLLSSAAILIALSAPAAVLAGDKPPAPNPTVLMSPVALPVVAGGQLVNYVFVTIRLGLSPSADAVKLRAMEPYFRDALVRAGHRTPFTRADNYTVLDDARLKAVLLREANAIAGAGMVLSAQIVREQSQHYSGLPKPTPSAR